MGPYILIFHYEYFSENIDTKGRTLNEQLIIY